MDPQLACDYCDSRHESEKQLTKHLAEHHDPDELSQIDCKRVEKYEQQSSSWLQGLTTDRQLSRRATLTAIGAGIVGGISVAGGSASGTGISLQNGGVFSQLSSSNPTFEGATFTNAEATGRTGPIQSAVDDEYQGTDLEGEVTVVGDGIQQWTVPRSATYTITARGANGIPASNNDNSVGAGRGITLEFEYELAAGEELRVLVGQEGIASTLNGGGGGATFITVSPHENESDIVAVAGGGGGRRHDAIGQGIDANDGEAGLQNESHSLEEKGTVFENTEDAPDYDSESGDNTVDPGEGGLAADGRFGDGGAGFFGDGRIDWVTSTPAESYLNGGVGGGADDAADGGFGGGGSGSGNSGGGGGGGYTGGNGGYTAGGGGSFVNDDANNITWFFDDDVTDGTSSGHHGFVEVNVEEVPAGVRVEGDDVTISNTTVTRDDED